MGRCDRHRRICIPSAFALCYILNSVEYAFRWNSANVEHILTHGVEPEEAEEVLCQYRAPFPRAAGDGKYLAWGQDADGRHLQVVFVYSPPGTAYVIHARPLDEQEKKRFRRTM
jgi:uncharacterized DUF497 family protein